MIALPEVCDWSAPAFDYFAQCDLFYRDCELETAARYLRGRLVYLATPYSKVVVDAAGQFRPQRSFVAGQRAAVWARRLAVEGVTAVSPIVQAASMVSAHSAFEPAPLDPLDAVFWGAWCLPLLRASRAVVVPPIPGWRESDGIWHEVRTALHGMRPVFVIKED